MANQQKSTFTPFKKETKCGWTQETWRLNTIKKWDQNEKDHSLSQKSLDQWPISSNFIPLGKFIMSSMPLSFDPTRKMISMDLTFLNHQQNLTMKKKSTKWILSLIIKNKDEAINTMWNGKDILSPKHCGNQNKLSPMMEICLFSTRTDIVSENISNTWRPFSKRLLPTLSHVKML